MLGFKPASQRNTTATGVVRGPGTGTSDSVKDAVPPGTYIMPADSTAQIGAEQLAGLGFRPGMRPAATPAPNLPLGFRPKGKAGGVPVNLSNGEFKLSPEQVHALGAQVLEEIKDATHTPVDAPDALDASEASERARPELFFADGGLVTDMNASRRSTAAPGTPATSPTAASTAPRPLATSPSNTYPGNQAEAAGNIYAKSNAELAGAVSNTFGNMARTSQLAAPFMPGSNTRTVAGQIGDTWEANKDKGFARAAGATLRGATALLPAAMEDGADAMGRATKPLRDFGKGFLGIEDAPPPAAAPAAPTVVPAKAPPAPAAPTSAPAAPAPATAAAPVTAPAGMQGVETSVPGVRRINEPGKSPLFTNIGPDGGAMGFRPGMGSQDTAPSAPGPGFGFRPGMGGPDVLGILQRESQIRAGMGALQDQIAFNGGGYGFRKTTNEEILRDMLVNGNSRDRATALGFTAGRQDAADRYGLTQQELGIKQQAAQTAQQVAAGELGLKQEAQGFQSAAARRQEALQARYDAAKTPEERAQIAQQIRDLSGKEAPKPDYEMAKARMNLVGELGKQYAQLQPIGEDKKPIPFETWAAPFMQAAGMGAADPRQQVRPMPAIGMVINGHRFRGGNPNDRNNWEKV